MRVLAIIVAGLSAALAGSEALLTPIPAGAEIQQRLNEQLPLDAQFRDEHGRAVRLGEYFGERPVLLAFVYLKCPGLCNVVLLSITKTLKVIKSAAGRDFEVVIISIDPQDTPDAALIRKNECVRECGKAEFADGWHMLTGEEDSIRRAASAAGFGYVYDPQTQQYAHAAGIFIATSSGRISKCFTGIDYPPRELERSLQQAGAGKIGSLSDAVLLFCFQYDAARGRYSLAIVRILYATSALAVVVLAGFILRELRRERRERRERAAANGRKPA